MTRKKIADNPKPSENAAAPAPAAKKARAPRASSTAVTHKHKKAPMASAAAETANLPEIIAVAETTPALVQTFVSPSHDEIAARAWIYYESRGYQGGSAEEDWFRAERELIAERRA